MRRSLAYVLVAFIGFILGSITYYISAFTLDFLSKVAPVIVDVMLKGKEFTGVFASGMLGSIIAVVSAHLWAKSSMS